MQTPKSILLHLDSSARTAERVKVARQLAQTFEAEVTAMPCMMPALLQYPFAIEGAAEAIAIMQQLDEEMRDKTRAAFFAAGGDSPRMRWCEPMRDAPWGFARRALYADLMILGQRDSEDAAARELPADFLTSLLVESGRPALVLPFTGPVRAIGGTVLLAWKETRESARAMSASLPWLRRAQSVHAVAYGDAARSSLDSLNAYLEGQGISATLHAGGTDESAVDTNLLSFASDVGADLLVMGCYGHSRTREWVLGGVTRTVLQSMTLPVLMTH
ncbi:MAG: universal stress protein [Burkholderiaceae bacterium]